MFRKVLIADDSDVNRQILKNILRAEYTLLEARDGQEALDCLHREAGGVSAVLLDLVMPVMDGYQVLQHVRADAALAQVPIIVTTGSADVGTEVRALSLGANDFVTKPYKPEVIRHRLANTINFQETAAVLNSARRDRLTGLLNREAFYDRAAELISAAPAGHFMLSCLDVDSFKIINDQYGLPKGDQVLKHIAQALRAGFEPVKGVVCRIAADNFAVLFPAASLDEAALARIREQAAAPDGILQPLTISVGRYMVEDPSASVSAMVDRASMAMRAVKGRYDVHVARYDASMRARLLREQRIVTNMGEALEKRQFEVWYQPQYNHATGSLVGAEALVRWRAEDGTLIPPGDFIPVFERNGFVYEVDKFVWEESCRLLRRWLDRGESPLSLSVNVSRYDIFRPDFFQVLTGLLVKYRIPAALLRLEITESAFAQSTQQIVGMLQRLIDYGFTVEIDDFGSGYSSLNTLKEVPATVLKLDMRFLEDEGYARRGGNILESVVRMAKWLGMSVIAEGVERLQQADYLKSIGCCYMQGYLFSRPLPLEDFERLAASAGREPPARALETVDALDNNAFWDPDSMETLIFNSYVGGACIFEIHGGKLELLRVNDKYARIIGCDTTEAALAIPLPERLAPESRETIPAALRQTMGSGQEAGCEVVFYGGADGRRRLDLRVVLRVIARAGDSYLVYARLDDITAQREAERKERTASHQRRVIMDNIVGGVTAVYLREGKPVFLFTNDQYYRQLGYTRAQFEAEVTDVFSLVHPEDRAAVVAETLRASETRTPTTCIFRVRRRDGTLAWQQSSISITALPGIDQPVQLSVATDITTERRAQQQAQEALAQLQFLNDTAHCLLAENDAEAGIRRVLRALADYFQGSRAFVAELVPGGGEAVCSYALSAADPAGALQAPEPFPLAEAPFWQRGFDGADTLLIEDTAALPEDRAAEGKLLLRRDIRALAAVPLRRDGRLIGFLGVENPGRQREHVDNLAALGDYMAVILTRRDLLEKIESDSQTLRRLMDDIPGGFVRMRLLPDRAAGMVYVNDGFCRLLDMERADILAQYGTDAGRGLHPDDRAAVGRAIDGLRSGGHFHIRCRMRRRGGDYIPLLVLGRMVDEAGGRFMNLYYADAGEQDRLEAQRELLLGNLPCGAGVYTYQNGCVTAVYLNPRHKELTGLSLEDMAGRSALELVHPDDRALLLSVLAEMGDGDSRACEARIQVKRGGYQSFQLAGSAARQADSPEGALIFLSFIPISQADSSYRSMLSVALQATMADSDDILFVKDRDLTYLCGSRALARSVGLADETELAGKTDFDLVSREMAQRYRESDQEILRSGQPLLNTTTRMPGPGGQRRYMLTSKYPLYDADGTIIGIYGIGRDITQSREAYQRLSLLADSIPGGLVSYFCRQDQLRLTYFNDGLCRLAGVTREDFQSLAEQEPLGLFLEEDRSALADFLRRLAEGESGGDCTCRLRTAEGGRKWVSIRGAAAERRNGAALVNAVVYDITALKETEERLLLSEEEKTLALSQIGKMICLYDVEAHTLTVPKAFASKHGVGTVLRDMPERLTASPAFNESSRRQLTDFYAAIARGDASGSAEVYVRCADGSHCWEQYVFSMVLDSAGKPRKAVISVEDVTAVHQANAETAALREDAQIFRAAAAHSNRSVFLYDIASMTSYASTPESDEIIGTTFHDIPEADIEGGHILPESIDEYRQVFQDMRAGKPGGKARIHMVDDRGNQRWFELCYSLVFTAEGKPKSAVISYLNITADHEKELAYHRYQQTIQLNSGKDSSLIYLESDITADVIEKQGGRALPPDLTTAGRSRTEVLEHIVRTYIVEAQREACRSFFSRATLITAFSDGNRSASEDWALALPDGETGYIRSEIQMVQDPFSGHIKAYTVLRDVTDETRAALAMRKQAELDGLTGVYNKTTTELLVRQRLEHTTHDSCALLVVDIDNLKSINDSLGHPQGDRAIRAIGAVLRAQFRSSDIVGRIGGDEFLTFLDGASDGPRLRSAIATLVKKLSEIRVGETDEAAVSASVGVAALPVRKADFPLLYQQADRALYQAKRAGKRQSAFYTQDMARDGNDNQHK